MRAAAEQELTVVPRGAGTKLHWGAPPERVRPGRATPRRSTGSSSTRPATSSSSAEAGPAAGRPAGTLAGDRPAARARRPRAGRDARRRGRHRDRRARGGCCYGTARDLLIGITVVRADGSSRTPAARWSRTSPATTSASSTPARTAPSALITEAAFRLHPLPPARACVTVTAGDGAQACRADAGAAALAARARPPIELDGHRPGRTSPCCSRGAEAVPRRARGGAAMLVGGDDHRRAARLVGTAARRVRWCCRGYAPPRPALPACSTRCPPDHVRGSAGRGRAGTSAARRRTPADALRAAAPGTAAGGRAVDAPDEPRALDRWGPVPALALMRRVKDQFDPGRRLSPGRCGRDLMCADRRHRAITGDAGRGGGVSTSTTRRTRS